MHGKGLMVYPNGDQYEGTFYKGKRHGAGQLKNIFVGDKLGGQWKKDTLEIETVDY